MTGIIWTEARCAILRDMWGKYSTSLIAERLGTSRAAIIGKADRLGLRGPGPLASSLRHNRLSAEDKAARKRKREAERTSDKRHGGSGENNAGAIRLRRQSRVSRPPRLLPPVPDDGKRGVPFAEVTGCKWSISQHPVPVRELRFCNCPKLADSPYCKEHSARAYVGKPAATGRAFSLPPL